MGDTTLIALVEWIRGLMDERGQTYAAVASKIPCHPSTLSRALSGHSIPSWPTVQRIVERCGGCEQQAWRLWKDADSARHAQQVRELEGYPPPDLCSYDDLVEALRDLLVRRRISQRELVRQDDSGILRRSTVGAILRWERSLRLEVTIALVQSCGVPEAAVDDWVAAWLRHGLPFEEAMDRRRRRIAYVRLRPPRHWRGSWR
ncbi:helix-turn-helix domain-containing protein [Allosalinactinospora lopnorensis]|uniref:helix-turn-helix domain-containing protein n=1 Tax=Allosalinactinospora lopnorensis TaxID=1352348 RepID=UPI000623CF5A|nr:helix-turn-helix transcriptional regulator [Allosalinactinospora lopnorensis]